MMRFPSLTSIRGFLSLVDRVGQIDGQMEQVRLAIGRMEARRIRSQRYASLAEAEFQVFSQWGEDGIIQYLVGKVPVENEVFVEFGVEDYRESNTRFLLQNDNWRGVILDASDAPARFLRERGLDWRHEIRAVQAFITRENIDELLAVAGIGGDIGILSIDIDGNDYWVLDAVRRVSPRILIVEYNSVFGPDASISVPYDPAFVRGRAHSSNLYYGASLAALAALADGKGYALVGSNSVGCNAFFVRRDVLGGLRSMSAREAWVRSRFREGQDESGALVLEDSHSEGLGRIAHLPVVDLTRGQTVELGEALSLVWPG